MTLAFGSPLLVSRATWLYVRPADRRQRSISASERQLLSLLERRRRRYLAKKESVEVDRKKESDETAQPTHVPSARDLSVDDGHCVCASLGMHPHPSSRQLRFGDATSPGSRAGLKRRSRTQVKSHPDKHCKPYIHCHNDEESRYSRKGSALTRYGCSELAEHVVNQAKVRLKRRQKRDLPSLMKIGDMQTGNSVSKSRIPCIQNLAAKRLQTKFKENLEASPKNEPKSRQINNIITTLTTQQTALLCKRPDVSKLTTISGSGRQLELTDRVNTTSSSPTKSHKVVYWSDRQSKTPKDTGIPNVPPVTPSSSYSQCFKFVPSLSDVKSQRQLRNRLQDIATKLKQKSELLNDETRLKEEERRKQKDALAKLKAQQRAEIYALNKIMAEFEEQKFQEFMSGKV